MSSMSSEEKKYYSLPLSVWFPREAMSLGCLAHRQGPLPGHDSVGAGPHCGVCSGGQGDALFVHSFGLRAHDEAEEVLVWDSGPAGRWRRGSTALVIQTGPLTWKDRSLL